HLQHLMNILSAIPDLQHFRLEAFPLALLANQFHVGQELHFDNHRAVALASLAATAWDVEGKVPRRESALVSLGCPGKEFAYSVKSFDISHRIRPRRTPDRRLVHEHNFIYKLIPFNLI